MSFILQFYVPVPKLMLFFFQKFKMAFAHSKNTTQKFNQVFYIYFCTLFYIRTDQKTDFSNEKYNFKYIIFKKFLNYFLVFLPLFLFLLLLPFHEPSVLPLSVYNHTRTHTQASLVIFQTCYIITPQTEYCLLGSNMCYSL